MLMTDPLTLEALDASGQKRFNVGNVPPDSSVAELIERLVLQMRLPQNDPTGQPLSYHALLDREGRHLNDSEQVGEALKSGDRLVLQPAIDAGGCGR